MRRAKLIEGECRSAMLDIEPWSIDSVVTDPPYGLKFMGKEWDHGVPGIPFWSAMLRIAKPGAHLLAFGGTRTHHRLMVAIEDAGWEIRNTIGWLYGSGFPKSLDVSKAIDKAAGVEREVVAYDESKTRPNNSSYPKVASGLQERPDKSKEGYRDNGATVTAPATDDARKWEGWGTALKPAWEPIIVARKPLIGTVAANVLEYGTGAINIDGCRVGMMTEKEVKRSGKSTIGEVYGEYGVNDWSRNGRVPLGRFPANIIHDGSAEVEAVFPDRKVNAMSKKGNISRAGGNVYGDYTDGGEPRFNGSSVGSASRFFYCCKASKSERSANGKVDNKHPTVKPISLMRYLVRLITPPGGLVLDPFTGSGSTGVAAIDEGMRFIGIEQDSRSYQTAVERITIAENAYQPTLHEATQ